MTGPRDELAVAVMFVVPYPTTVARAVAASRVLRVSKDGLPCSVAGPIVTFYPVNDRRAGRVTRRLPVLLRAMRIDQGKSPVTSHPFVGSLLGGRNSAAVRRFHSTHTIHSEEPLITSTCREIGVPAMLAWLRGLSTNCAKRSWFSQRKPHPRRRFQPSAR